MYKYIVLVIFWLTTSLFCSPLMAQEPNDSEGDIRYISDNLFTYLHSGPGRNFRILGSVVAGTRVTVLQEDNEKEFIEIIDDKQRTGWVDADFISIEPSLKELVPSLQQQVQENAQTIAQQRQNNDLLNQQIADLNSQNENLKKQVRELENENSKFVETLASYDQTAQMEWFTRGGIVAVISLILGVVITYLPKKKRRTDNWM